MKLLEGTYVTLSITLFEPSNRSSKIPEDTQKQPYQMRVKGYLNAPSKLKKIGHITTRSGHHYEGLIINAEPFFAHHFGHRVNLIDEIKKIILDEAWLDV